MSMVEQLRGMGQGAANSVFGPEWGPQAYFLGSTLAMTFSDGNEVTFTGDRATKIETVKLSKELSDLKKAAAAQKEYGGPNNAGIPPKSPLGWKSQFGGTALDRRPYTKYNGHIYYSDSDDPDKLGTATESSKRNGLYRDK